MKFVRAGLVLAVLAGVTACGSSLPANVPDGLFVATAAERPTDHEKKLAGVFRSLGFQVETVHARKVFGGAPRPVFFPSSLGSAVTVDDARALRRAVQRGAHVAVEGQTVLAQAMGVAFTGEVEQAPGGRGTKRYELEATWSSSVQFSRFRVDAPGVFRSPDGTQVAAAGRLGKGRFLFVAVDVLSTDSQVRYPGLGEMVRAAFGMRAPALGRPAIEVLFDPALRAGVDPDDLARMWASRGIRAVHVGAWYPPAKWPYAAYVEELHRVGLKAYLWLEPPMVSKPIWDANPQCRERTATGSDTTADWRSLFALEDPNCMKLAVQAYGELIRLAPWDGIGVSELYFEGPGYGPARPDTYTPLHPWVRKDFAASHGFDPQVLFDPKNPRYRLKDAQSMQAFATYRAALVTRLHRDLVAALRPLLPEGDIVVTVIDGVLDPNVARNVGMDPGSIAPLSKDYGLRLQVEDPFTTWGRDPDRYVQLREAWDKLAVPYSVDLNVVDREQKNPTVRMGGAELARAAAAATDAHSPLTIYAESSVLEDDWTTVQAALASRASVTAKGKGFVVTSDSSLVVALPPGWKAAKVDGVPWRFGELGSVLLPPGEHELQQASATPSGWALDRTSCDVSGGTARRLDLSGTGPCYVRVRGATPPATTMDGKAVEASRWWTSEGGSTLRIPPGEHRLLLG